MLGCYSSANEADVSQDLFVRAACSDELADDSLYSSVQRSGGRRKREGCMASAFIQAVLISHSQSVTSVRPRQRKIQACAPRWAAQGLLRRSQVSGSTSGASAQQHTQCAMALLT